MERRVLISASNERRLAVARDAFASINVCTGAVVVAPTRSAADEFLRCACTANSGFVGAYRFTPLQLAYEICAEVLAAEGLTAIGDLGREAVAARSLFTCLNARPLTYFGPVASTAGFRTALASTLTELRLALIRPAAVAQCGEVGEDLARLALRYERELADRGLVDAAAVYQIAAGRLQDGPHPLATVPIFLLDVAPRSQAEQVFLAAIAGRVPIALATAPDGDVEGIRALEVALGVQADRLGPEPGANSLECLRENLFIVGRPGRPLDTTVDLFSAPGEALECVEVARRILRLAESGIAFDRVAVLLRGADGYLPFLEDAFRRARIPAYFTRGVIRPDPAGRAFLSLLDCAAEGLSASRFAEYLSLGQVPMPGETGGVEWVPSEDELHFVFRTPGPEALAGGQAPPDNMLETKGQAVVAGTLRTPAGWEKLLVEAAVVGGRDRWERRLHGLEAEYRVQVAELEKGDPEKIATLQQRVELLENLERFALPLIGRLAELPQAAAWGAWLRVLTELARAALRYPQGILAILAELEPMAEVGPATLDEVRRVLANRLRFLRREPPHRRYGQVFVASVDEAAAQSFDVVFLPGLAEGLFPRKAREDPLLLDDYRRSLSPALLLQADRVARERLRLALAAGAAHLRLIVSWPRIDLAQGRARVPSFYALEVLRAAEGRLPELQELESRAKSGSGARVGWPAPRHPTEAIDDMEFDLATLDPLLGASAESVRGCAAYLISANRWLAGSLRAHWRRWHRRWTGADGIVDPPGTVLNILASERPSFRPYSPSSLQHYASCPYRFLLGAIHQLRPREESRALESMDPLTRGALFHSVQRELFRELSTAGLLPVTANNLASILDIADTVFGRVAAEYEEELAPAIPTVWASEIEGLRTDLRAWIVELIVIHATWLPEHFEFSFGMPLDGTRDPVSVPAPVVLPGSWQIRGAIDLVERHLGERSLRVTDHKTGRVPSPIPLVTGGGTVLQPVIYALAAEQLFGLPVDSGLLYYCTQRGGYTQVAVPFNARARACAESVFQTVDTAVSAGFLPAAPDRGACALCDYISVCGPNEERRLTLKSQDRLAPLEALRILP